MTASSLHHFLLSKRRRLRRRRPAANSREGFTASPTSARHKEIALRAYGLWEQRGSPLGPPEEDWFRAEQEIRSERASLPETAEGLPARFS
ncbi:MAG TPA: DUF2934 domain-containing protein [Terriglobia bacterium]|nr:DUF2934 domain-containing protein [Terriglobia bacterium]